MPRFDVHPPLPPITMPPARTVNVPGRGEMFLRDTGGDGTPVLLLHGWLASADLNWWRAYDDLADAGYRVLAIDHRGHGRGLRTMEPFRLLDCAADAAGALRELETGPALVVGYSMGGAIASLVAREHPDVVRGLVLSGTKMEFQGRREMRTWRGMIGLRAVLQAAPYEAWRRGLERAGIRSPEIAAWIGSELLRHSPRDVAEAGRELGRFDSRAWIGRLGIPTAVVITTEDREVSPRKQQALAEAAGAAVFEAPVTHMGIVAGARVYNPPLLQALESVATREPAPVA
jgi:3-oxoadipate enol-lactonase